jgi:hypothetical protein
MNVWVYRGLGAGNTHSGETLVIDNATGEIKVTADNDSDNDGLMDNDGGTTDGSDTTGSDTGGDTGSDTGGSSGGGPAY